MSKLPIQTLSIPQVSPLTVFARFLSFLMTVLNVFAESQEMARAAHKRYPFVDR
jgi:hypothetical protein